MVEVKEMMVHVERIVRSVRATERRKLQMRRELLGHVQAALEEERAGGLEERAAWDAAKKRLGEPAALTAELQRSVPWVERTMRMPVRGLQWLSSAQINDKRLHMGFEGMRGWHRGMYMAATMILILGPLGALSSADARPHLHELMLALANRSWQLQLSVLCTVLLLPAVQVLAFKIQLLGAEGRLRRAAGLGMGVSLLVVAWQVAIYALLAGPGAPWPNLAGGALVGAIVAVGMAELGRFLRPGIREFGEWLELDVA